MKYALGNMLNGAGGLNPDGLSLDLQFASDKSLTARKGPTPTFTRASTATFIGSDGLIQSAAINAPRFDHDPVTLASKGLLLEESRTNLVFPSDTLTTQTRTVTAVAHTLSFYGTGTVVLSGVAIATLTGTGAYPTRTALTFTPTAGSLIMTVTGSVTQAQLEAGSFATSYIPTTTTALARSADVCSITGTDFTKVYNQSEVSIFSEFEFQASNASAIVHCNNSTAGEVLALSQFSNPSRLAIFVVDNGSTQSAVNANANINQVYKSAISAKLNSFQFALNGILGTRDTEGTMPTPTQINIGKTQSAIHLNGRIKQIKIFRKELSEAKLQALTA
jgi:hypothetical protein